MVWNNCEVHQIIGPFGRSSLDRNLKRLSELRDWMLLRTMDQAHALAVTDKSLEHYFESIPGIATAHHGAIAGIDSHVDVGAAFIIGGVFPNLEDVASIAAARGGGAVQVARPERVTRVALLTSGEGVEIPVMAYADPAADAVHTGIYVASIVQAAGRVRPPERTASNPVKVYVCANAVLPFPVDSVQRWRDMRPDRLGRMIARGAIWSNAADMARFQPELFKSERAAAHARERSVGVVDDMREAVIGVVRHHSRPWVEVAFQPAGQGHKLRYVWCPKGAESAIRQAIVDELGEPVYWEVQSLTSGKEDISVSVLCNSQGFGDIIPPPLANPGFARPDISDAGCRVLPDG